VVDYVERLVAIEDIKQVKARYFRCMDTKDWDGFTAQFSDDAVMDVSGDVGDDAPVDARIVRGGRAIGNFVRSAVDDVVTVHHGHMPEITLTSPTTASGVWAMEDMLRWPDGSPLGEMHGYGHYEETYEKRDGRWLITFVKLTRLRSDFTTS
jgi:hypothetical protein